MANFGITHKDTILAELGNYQSMASHPDHEAALSEIDELTLTPQAVQSLLTPMQDLSQSVPEMPTLSSTLTPSKVLDCVVSHIFQNKL